MSADVSVGVCRHTLRSCGLPIIRRHRCADRGLGSATKWALLIRSTVIVSYWVEFNVQLDMS